MDFNYIRRFLGRLKSQSIGAEALSDQGEPKRPKFAFETVKTFSARDVPRNVTIQASNMLIRPIHMKSLVHC